MKIKFIYIFIISIAIMGCKDVFEEDISKEKLIILTPSDNSTSGKYNQLFWWEELEGASQYNLIIVSPSFANIQTIIMDTLVTSTKFTKTLEPGNYEWKIRAENGSYFTDYQQYSLTIAQSSLNDQTITRLSPSNATYQKNFSFTFTWESVYGAEQYWIQIDSITGNFTNPVEFDSTASLEQSFNLPKEGEYKWRMKATNSSGEATAWTNSWYIGYYTSLPSAPTLLLPANNATTSATVTFSWNTVARAKTYTLYLYADNALEPTKVTGITGTSYQKTFTTENSIDWYVTCTDKAGNESLPSSTRSITIQ